MSYKDLPHLRSNGASVATAASPTVAAGSAAGTAPTVTHTGFDERGVVNVTAGTTPGTGTLVTITFATPYEVAPDAVLISDGGGTGVLSVVEANATVTNTAVTIAVRVAPTAADVYKINYVVVGGA